MVEARLHPALLSAHVVRQLEGALLKRACVVGSGPNGLTAAILLARAGVPTTVLEAEATIGGGTRSAELTLPGFVHDVCSAVHPFAISSPAWATFPLAEHGLEWIHPALPLAHPLDDGSAVTLDRSIESTAAQLGPDGPAYRTTVAPLVQRWPDLAREVLQATAAFSRASFLARPIWMVGLATGIGRRTPDVSHRARPCIIRRISRSFDPAAGDARIGRHRMDARHCRTRCWLAHPARRIAAHRERARILLPISRRRNYHQHPSPVAPRSGRRRAHLVGRHAAPVARDRRPSASRRVLSASCARTATAPEYSKSIGRSAAPFPGKPPSVREQERFTSAER